MILRLIDLLQQELKSFIIIIITLAFLRRPSSTLSRCHHQNKCRCILWRCCLITIKCALERASSNHTSTYNNGTATNPFPRYWVRLISHHLHHIRSTRYKQIIAWYWKEGLEGRIRREEGVYGVSCCGGYLVLGGCSFRSISFERLLRAQ